MSEGIPLWHAAATGDVERVRELLCCGVDPDRPHEGQTPLTFAAANGRADVARLLIANGVDVMSCDSFRMTPLHWAVRNSHLDVSEVLLEHGARTNSQSLLYGETPCDIAKVRGDYRMCRLVVWGNRTGKVTTTKEKEEKEKETPPSTPVEANETAAEERRASADAAAIRVDSMRGCVVDGGGEVETPSSPVPPIPERKRVPPPPEAVPTRPKTPPRMG